MVHADDASSPSAAAPSTPSAAPKRLVVADLTA
ncbi:hypothetical protein PPSIR1_09151 [Plesiocystis pacifica SIR-1]|uniref:Uncharacterized protein n=1 Tax=Plesiocystis pacifica SIR-1 TaxID=391625 RepID=A6G759_9BACT|nr:hypothetical protein PPSIR1_09151 [Plesiocystis pacifica SIR-1]